MTEETWTNPISTKEKHLKRRFYTKHKTERLRNRLLSYRRNYSVSVRYEWNEAQQNFVPTERIDRPKSSKRQQVMKKHSNRIIRRLKAKELIRRGNGARKYYDYKWNLD